MIYLGHERSVNNFIEGVKIDFFKTLDLLRECKEEEANDYINELVILGYQIIQAEQIDDCGWIKEYPDEEIAEDRPRRVDKIGID